MTVSSPDTAAIGFYFGLSDRRAARFPDEEIFTQKYFKLKIAI